MAKAKSNDNSGSKRRFTTVEKSFVVHNMSKLSPEEMAKELGRTPKSVIKVIKTLTESGNVEENLVANTVETKSETPPSTIPFDPNSNAKAPQGVKAGDLMAGGEKQGRPGVVMMTSAASQALDEFKKSNAVAPSRPHDASIHRIRK